MKNLLQKRWVRALVWTAVSLITLYALLCAWVNWTGARMLSDALTRLKAEGETTDFRAVTREPVPDAQNFCAIPALKDLPLEIDGDSEKGEPAERRRRLNALKFPSGDKIPAKPRTGRQSVIGTREDLGAWRDWLLKAGFAKDVAKSDNPARDLLNALSPNEPLFAELAAGIDRPHSEWTPAWRTRELPENLFAVAMPHYNASMTLNHPLALRAKAAARAGDAARAHQSLRIMARLSEANINDPFLIGLLVAATNSGVMIDALWEVCDAKAGSTADFAVLESLLASADFKLATLRALRAEMAAGLNTMQYVKAKRDPGIFLVVNELGGQPSGAGAATVARMLPAGFWDGSSAVLMERELDTMIKPMRDQGWMAAIDSVAKSDAKVQQERKRLYLHPYGILASLMVPAVSSVIQRAAYTQCLVDQATIACALERYRIEKGAYPDSLAGMTLANGKSLPMDALSGKPIGYRKTDNGKYALWCVGFDGKDDGGKRVLDEKKPQDTKFADKNYKGDWVWDFPTTK
ncbi:MAG: hypothetical protein K1X78_27000 [Verrucomicrobiaceae bacterium]|nr:hypothetical protein [Verrucomicrobiaceae bacterium]